MTDIRDEEWGPWIEHDGKGCPCVGQMVMVERRDPECGSQCGPYIAHSIRVGNAEAGNPFHDSWVHLPKGRDIIRYRIRRPRALLDLIQLIADLPAPVAPIKTDGVIA